MKNHVDGADEQNKVVNVTWIPVCLQLLLSCDWVVVCSSPVILWAGPEASCAGQLLVYNGGCRLGRSVVLLFIYFFTKLDIGRITVLTAGYIVLST